MDDRKKLLKFISKGRFSKSRIDEIESRLSISERKLIRKTFEIIKSEISVLDKTQDYIYVIVNSVDLLTALCNEKDFSSEEILVNRKRIKQVREALLSYSNKLDNEDLLHAANKLDEIILDKGIDLEDLVKLIIKLIDKKEDVNIIKKLLNTNKGVLLIDKNELFDYAFYKALESINNNTPDIYYYISLLKIFYSSKIDKTKYLHELSITIDETGIFLNEIYFILHGHKREYSPEAILDKYGILTELETKNIIIPKKTTTDEFVLSIDTEGTNVRDDAFSIRKDGNNYMVGIHIADPASFIEPNSIIDIQARNNFSCVYMNEKSIRTLPRNMEESLSLNKDTNRKVLTLDLVIDNEGNIKDTKLLENVIKINENLYFEQSDLILNNSNDLLSQKLVELYEVACLLEQKNKKKYIYWEKKENDSIDKKVVNHQSNKIVNELMVIYNHLVAKLARDNCIPYTYKIQFLSYLDYLVKKMGISVDAETENIIKNIYLKSKYSDIPLFHSGLNLDVYSPSSSPLIKYPSLYNQFLLHKFYFKDIDFEFDELQHKDLIEYFNQRNTELSLMASEYVRALKLKKD